MNSSAAISIKKKTYYKHGQKVQVFLSLSNWLFALSYSYILCKLIITIINIRLVTRISLMRVLYLLLVVIKISIY